MTVRTYLATLTGNPGDDTYAIGAGSGAEIPPSGGSGITKPAADGYYVHQDGTGLPNSVVHAKDVTEFGAKVDGRMLSGLTLSGTSLTGTSGTFQASDVGKTICLFLAYGSGIAGQTTISAYGSSSSVTLTSSIASPPAISQVQEAKLNQGGDGSATSFTVSLSGVAAKNSLILYAVYTVNSQKNPNLTVSDNAGGVWVKVTGQLIWNGFGPTETDVWQCVSSPGGAVTVTVTGAFAAYAGGVALQLMEYAGIGAVDKVSSAYGTSTTVAPPAITPSISGELVMGFGYTGGSNPSVSPSSPWTTEVGATWVGGRLYAPVAWQVAAGTGPYTLSWTQSSYQWGAIVVVFRPIGPVTAGIVGTDDTTAWSSAFTWAAGQPGNAGRITYNAGPGISLIAGAPQVQTVNGSGWSYTTNGQLLLPGLNLPGQAGLIEIAGTSPAVVGATETIGGYQIPPVLGTLVLFSTATSGYVVDVISGTSGFLGAPFSSIQFNLRRAAVRTVCNVTGNGPGGLNLWAAAGASFDESSVDVANAPAFTEGSTPRSTGPTTMAGTALILPTDNNNAVVNWRRSQIVGYPKGLAHSEHAHLSCSYIGNCGAALVPGMVAGTGHPTGSHSCVYDRVLLQANRIHIEPMTGRGAYGMSVSGRLEIEGPFDCFMDDPSHVLAGEITVGPAFQKLAVRSASSGLAIRGFPPKPQAYGAVPLIDPLNDRAASAIGSTPFGMSTTSYHTYNVRGTAAIDVNGAFGWPAPTALPWLVSPLNAPTFTSKHYSIVIKTSATTNRAYAGLMFRSSDPNSIGVVLEGNANQRVALYTGNTTWFTGSLVTSASATIAANTSYTLDVYVRTNTQPGAGVLISAYLSGTFMFSYMLTAAQAATYAATGYDGFGGYLGGTSDDGGSRLTNYSIQPASDISFVTNGTAILSAGTIAVANTLITANSKVRVFNDAAGGTVGALSVALNAGTGFTINSSSGSDTSTIYYEVVSY